MRLLPLISSLLVIATVTVQAGQSAKSITKRFDRLDLNGDGAIDTGEFAKLLPAKLSKNNALVQTQAAMFAWFDQDASNGIDLDEWLETMSGGNPESPDFSAEVVDELDTNHDGNLTWKEFNRVMNFCVSPKTAREWLRAISINSLVVNKALRVTADSDTGSEGALSPAGPREWVTTTGGDCLAPAPSTSGEE